MNEGNRGKRPKVHLESLKISSKTLEYARKLLMGNPHLLTPFQLKVLSLYREKTVKSIVKEDGISKESVYAVFRALREKKKRSQLYLKLIGRLTRDPRLHPILTLKPSIEDEREEEKTTEEED